MTFFAATNLRITFGGLTAVKDFSLAVPAGQLHGLIGPNGAGKTTVFNMLSGLYTPDRGSVTLRDVNLTQHGPAEIAAAGVARTFQNIRLCGHLSALDNVCIGAHVRLPHGLWHSLLRTARHTAADAAQRAAARALLALVGLADHAERHAATLCYGDQRRLEIARALATQPTVLLLDEPAAGMNPQEKIALAVLIRTIRRQFNLTIVLIDHDMGLVMSLCDAITVLDHGDVIACGAPAAVQNDPAVIAAYLGTPTTEQA